METRHLRLNPEMGLVRLKCDEGDDILLGHLDDDSECPDEYLAEWDWLRAEMADRERFAAACYREATMHDLTPENWT